MVKKILFSTAVLAVLFSCDNASSKKDYAVISGKSAQNAGKNLTLLLDRKPVKEIPISSEGTFRDTIKDLQSNPNYILLLGREGALPLYLQGGTEVQIDFEGNLSDAKVTGNDADKMRYILERNNFVAAHLDGSDRNLFGQKPQEFKSNIKQQLDVLRKKIDSFGLKGDFANEQKRWIDYQYVTLLNIYPDYNSYLSNQEVTLPDDFFDQAQEIDYDNAQDYDRLDSYKNLVRRHYVSLLTDPQNKEQLQNLINELSKAKSDNIKQDIMAMMAGLIVPGGVNNEMVYSFLEKNLKNEKIKEEISLYYEQCKKLAPGTQSPSFNFDNYKGGKTTLESLKGKVLYLDIWATWCKPCREEIPYMKELEQKFRGKNIEFVGISIDNPQDKEKWQKFVSENQMKGVQLFADNAWQSQFAQDYLVRSIPRFILVDAEGKIINADAPSPSDEKTEQLLNSLL